MPGEYPMSLWSGRKILLYGRKREVPKGGDERTGFLCALTVFYWVSLSCGCASNVPVHPGCVSVSLHFLLHGFYKWCF